MEEELGVKLSITDIKSYYHITAQAFGEKGHIIMEQDCFLGPVSDHYHANNKIGAIRYFSYEAYRQQESIVPGVIIAFEQLITDHIITKDA